MSLGNKKFNKTYYGIKKEKVLESPIARKLFEDFFKISPTCIGILLFLGKSLIILLPINTGWSTSKYSFMSILLLFNAEYIVNVLKVFS